MQGIPNTEGAKFPLTAVACELLLITHFTQLLKMEFNIQPNNSNKVADMQRERPSYESVKAPNLKERKKVLDTNITSS